MRSKSVSFLQILFLVVLSTAPAALIGQTSLRIAAAADLEPVLPAILTQFEQETGIHADATYQSSAALTAQIQNGAPFDIFLSADLGYPQKLIAAGLAQGLGDGANGTPIAYAHGTLVLWARKDAHLPALSMDLLRRPEIQRIAIANPDRAPYGRAAVAALQKSGLYEAVKSRLVTAENISQAAQFVDSGNADVGFLSLTSASTPRLKAEGNFTVVPTSLYNPIEQGAVLVTKAPHRVEAKTFLVYLMSTPVQQGMREYGLTPSRPVP
ncbi:molybdate ABC transporter substrate-binding protein [Acidobacteria bacterium AB60]|nr:molybdate ABC transporter substrate-binding protein [Acidobacteria bacterium AB60]